jgi:DNA polymerase-3 subunit alpha
LLRARELDGPFQSIEDFAKRVSTTKFNRKAWESLIKSGGFDSLADRSDLLFNLDTITAFASKLQKEALSGQTDLFGMLSEQNTSVQPTMSLMPSPAKHTDKERLTWERELLGLYISAHPLDNYDTYFEEQTVPLGRINGDIDGKPVTIGGIVSTVRTIITKSGSKMAFVKIEDKANESEIVVFPNLFEQVGAKLQQDAVIRVTGKVNARDREGNLKAEASVIADEVIEVTDEELRSYESTGRKMEAPRMSSRVKAARVAAYKEKKRASSGTVSDTVLKTEAVATAQPAQSITPHMEVVAEPQKVFVQVKTADDEAVLQELRKICADNPGTTDIILVLGTEKKSAIRLPFRIEVSDACTGALVKLVGEDGVVIK